MTEDRWMNYADAAEALGMTAESIRQRARREGWRKTLGNDGRALILIPADTTGTGRTPPGDADHGSDDTPEPQPVTQPNTDQIIAVYEARITDIEARAAELRADVERERVERLRERDRADALADRAADMARELAQAVSEGAARERELLAQAAAAETVLAEYRARPWWRRLRA